MSTLPKESFLALVAVGWVDGQLQRVEIAGLTRAAKEAGLAADEIAEIEAATKKQTRLTDFDFARITPWEQVLTYALAAWIAEVDGVVSTSESEILAALGDKLGLTEPQRKRANVAAHDIACLPGGGRPDKYDFKKLEERLKVLLPSLAK